MESKNNENNSPGSIDYAALDFMKLLSDVSPADRRIRFKSEGVGYPFDSAIFHPLDMIIHLPQFYQRGQAKIVLLPDSPKSAGGNSIPVEYSYFWERVKAGTISPITDFPNIEPEESDERFVGHCGTVRGLNPIGRLRDETKKLLNAEIDPRSSYEEALIKLKRESLGTEGFPERVMGASFLITVLNCKGYDVVKNYLSEELSVNVYETIDPSLFFCGYLDTNPWENIKGLRHATRPRYRTWMSADSDTPRSMHLIGKLKISRAVLDSSLLDWMAGGYLEHAELAAHFKGEWGHPPDEPKRYMVPITERGIMVPYMFVPDNSSQLTRLEILIKEIEQRKSA